MWDLTDIFVNNFSYWMFMDGEGIITMDPACLMLCESSAETKQIAGKKQEILIVLCINWFFFMVTNLL